VKNRRLGKFQFRNPLALSWKKKRPGAFCAKKPLFWEAVRRKIDFTLPAVMLLFLSFSPKIKKNRLMLRKWRIYSGLFRVQSPLSSAILMHWGVGGIPKCARNFCTNI
jgi:hypothetical protein